MNVIFLTFTYPSPESPAAGIFVKEHARAAARHANVAVVHLQRGGGHYRVEDVPDEEFRTIRVRYPYAKTAYWRHFAGAATAVARLRGEGFAPDLIHAHIFLAALPPLLLRPAFRLPVVVTEQWSVFLPEDPATLSPPMQTVARQALRRAEFVLPASAALQHGMEALGIQARFRVVPNVVDTDLFHAGPTPRDGDERQLLYVGLLYPAKGVETMLEATALVASRHGRVQLELVGDGPGRDAYERLAAELGISKLVRFSGLLPKDEVARRMRAADLFLLTSRFDNNPCSLIEAQASGLPAVATRVGGIPEILEAGSGLLAAPGDAEDIAAKVIDALERPDAFDRTSIARHAHDRYGVDAVAKQLRQVYVEATRDAASRSRPPEGTRLRPR